MIRAVAFSAFASLTLLSACGPIEKPFTESKEAWNQSNDPSRFGVGTVRLGSVQTSGRLPTARMPWSGNYWPSYKGGISHRWQTQARGSSYTDYLYQVLSPSELQNLTQQQARTLSPAEKYDLFVGRTSFALTATEKQRTLALRQAEQVPTWYGICDGWAAASHLEPEPGARAPVRAPNGLTIEFNHADLEALLSYAYARLPLSLYKMVGTRCNRDDAPVDSDGRTVADECRDLNPASFHLIAADYINKQQRAFLADIVHDQQVWNYPIVGYDFRYSNRRALDASDPRRHWRAPGTTALVDVAATLVYIDGTPSTLTPNGSSTSQVTLFYSLELNAQDYIVGGEWISEGHPDFLWSITHRPSASADNLVDLGLVQALVAYSRGEGPAPRPHQPPVVSDPVPPIVDTDPYRALYITQWNYRMFPDRVSVALAGTVSPNASEVRLILVRSDGERIFLQRVRPDRAQGFYFRASFAQGYVTAVVIEAVDPWGRRLGYLQRPVVF